MSAGAQDALWQDARPDRDGLVPCIVQDIKSRAVLMVAWVNEAALAATAATGWATFWSRSRRALWEKGATSGNRQRVREIRLDCDGDTLIYVVEPAGPACHEGTDSCFTRVRDGAGWRYDAAPILGVPGLEARSYLAALERTLDHGRAPAGLDRSAAELKERAEALAHALGADRPEVVARAAAALVESAGLAVRQRGVSFDAVWAELRAGVGHDGS